MAAFFSLEKMLGVSADDIMAQALAMRQDFDAIRLEVAGLQRDREGLKVAFQQITARVLAKLDQLDRKLDDALVMTSMMECNQTVEGAPPLSPLAAGGEASAAPSRVRPTLRLAAGAD